MSDNPTSFSFFVFFSSLSMSMVFSSTVPCVSKMVELCANGLETHIFFPLDANGFAFVSSLHLSITFSLQHSTIWVKREFYDHTTSLLSLTMCVNSKVANNGSSVWKLCTGKNRVYGLPNSSTHVSTEICIPPHSSSSILNTLLVIKVKIELGIHPIIHLSNSSDGD